jgi:hypothetical protein
VPSGQHRLLRTLNVRQLLDAEGFRNFAALPRAWLVGRAERIDDPAQRLHRLAEPSFDPGLVAVLEEATPPLEESPVGSVDRRGPTEYRATCDRPCLLVISETHHPGWRAIVDGRPERVLRVDHALRGLPLTPGAHTISFEFRPRSVSWGLACSGSTLLLLGALFLVRARFERRIGGGFP